MASGTYAVDGLVEDDLGLVELLLDLGDAVGLVGVLVRLDELLEGGELERVIGGGGVYRRDRLLGQELVHELGQDAVGRDVGVILGDDDAGDALGAGVAVDDVVWRRHITWVSALIPSWLHKSWARRNAPCSSTLCL